MLISFLKKIYNVFRPVKTYTIDEWSKKTIQELREAGAKIGENVDIIDAAIDRGCPYLITIGNNVTITNCRILTHDASIKKELGYTKIGHITIGDDVFIGANSIILPNTTIGSKVIVGAGSVVAHDIPDNSVVVGNPCKIICTYDEYMEKQRNRMKTVPVFDFPGRELKTENRSKERTLLEKEGMGFYL